MRIQKASPDTFARRLPEVIRLYTAEYHLSPAAAREREAIMLRHIGRRRFVAFLALDGDDLLGFAYGYAGGPGEYWYDLVYEAMPPAMREAWLGEHFEFVELLVAPRPGAGASEGDCMTRFLKAGPSPSPSSPCGRKTPLPSGFTESAAGRSCSMTSASAGAASGFT